MCRQVTVNRFYYNLAVDSDCGKDYSICGVSHPQNLGCRLSISLLHLGGKYSILRNLFLFFLFLEKVYNLK